MDSSAVTCHYRLTRDEYIDIQLYVRRRAFGWRAILIGTVFFMPISLFFKHDTTFSEASTKWDAGDIFGFLNLVFPVVIWFGAVVFALGRILPVRSLCSTARLKREPALLNQERTILVGEKGIHADIADQSFDHAWDFFSVYRECDHAFAFHCAGHSSILWLPKHGFSSQEEIAQCRALLQQHAKKFRTVR